MWEYFITFVKPSFILVAKKDSDIRIRNESETFKRQARNVAKKHGRTLSSYVRKLIREDMDRQPESYKNDVEEDGC